MKRSRYHDRVLGYFDILGWSEMVRASQKRNEVLFDLFRVLIDLGEGWEGRTPAHNVQFVQFSDHVCISTPADDELALVFVAVTLHGFVERLLEMGYATRGAIVIGPLVHTGSVIFGPALLEAHEIESKVAQYPRIVLSERTLEVASALRPPRNVLRRKDSDGMYFLDVFDTLTSVRQINRIRRALEQKAPARSTLDITVKKNWLRERLSERAAQVRAAQQNAR